jgi:L-lactate dehydrogenase complex protein LldF
MMRHWREREYEKHLTPKVQRWGLKAGAMLVKRPRLHHLVMSFVIPTISLFGRRKGYLRHLPLAGGWTKYRDLPTPETRTFQQQWAQRETLKQEAPKQEAIQ